MQTLLALQKEKEKRALKNNYHLFVEKFWDTISTQSFGDSPYIKYLCDEVSQVFKWTADWESQKAAPYVYNLLVNISPGMTKSTIISKMGPAWLWLQNPDVQMIAVSYAADPVKDFTDKFKMLLDSDEFRSYFPEMKLRVDNVKDQKNIFKGRRFATTVGGSITGIHGDILIIDDPHQPPTVARDEKGRPKLKAGARITEIKQANSWFDDKLSSRRTNKLFSRFIIVQQRVHRDDMSGYLLYKAKKNFPLKHIILPIDQPDKAIERTYIKGKVIQEKKLGYLYDKATGLLDPIRVPQEALEEDKVVMGSYVYQAQHRQAPNRDVGGVIKRKWFPIVQKSEVPNNLVKFFYTDPSEGKADSDNMATICWSLWNGKIYVWNINATVKEFGEYIGHRNEKGEYIKKAYDIFVEQQGSSWQSRHFFEAKSSGSAYISYMNTSTPYNAIPDIPIGSKMDRVNLSLGVIESGRVVLVEDNDNDWIGDFLEECEEFSGKDGDPDDRVDVLTGMIKMTEFEGSIFETKREPTATLHF